MELCKYGAKCFRQNSEHLKNFRHGSESENKPVDLEIVDKENVNERRESLEKNSCKKRKMEVSEIAQPEIRSDRMDLTKVDESETKPVDLENENVDERREKLENNSCKKRKMEVSEIKSDRIDLTKVEDIKSLVMEHNKMQMPEDFYALLEFCKQLDPQDTKNALKVLNIRLVGVFDLLLTGEKLNYKLHSRHYYDPPEFQTVLNVTDSDTLLHFGYFRDDPAEMPNFVAINEAKMDAKLICRGENIFSAINWYLGELLANKAYKSTATKDELMEFKKIFTEWIDTHYKSDKKFSMQLTKTARIKSREKKVVCKTIHQLGLVVPVDTRGFGYREVPESMEAQKKMFANCCVKSESDKKRRIKGEDAIEEIITLIQFANDETDYGMGLEFGLNMFSFGELGLHKYIRSTLPVCYNLLNRKVYADIVREHLKNRKQLSTME